LNRCELGSSYECRVPQFRHRRIAPTKFFRLELVGIELGRADCRWGLPGSLFRLRGGFPVQPWPRFPRPPDNPGRPDFPGPVRNLGISSVSLPIVSEVQALVRIHPDFRGWPTASFHHMRRLIAGSEPGDGAADENREVSRVPLPPAGVTVIGETCTAS
jgi:hypothetical protein